MKNLLTNIGKIEENYTSEHKDVYIHVIKLRPILETLEVTTASDRLFTEGYVTIISNVSEDDSYSHGYQYTLNSKDLKLYKHNNGKRWHAALPEDLNNKVVLLNSYKNSHIDPRIFNIILAIDDRKEILIEIEQNSSNNAEEIINDIILDLLVFEKV